MSNRGRDEQEDAGKQLDQLLQELRVAIPGVQMLFGFLLMVPFNDRFQHLGMFQKTIFFFVFAATTLSSIVLIAPSAYHRIHKGKDVDDVLSVSNKLALIGLALLGSAITGCVYLITGVVLGGAVARIATIVAAAATLGAWLLLPMSSGARHRVRESMG